MYRGGGKNTRAGGNSASPSPRAMWLCPTSCTPMQTKAETTASHPPPCLPPHLKQLICPGTQARLSAGALRPMVFSIPVHFQGSSSATSDWVAGARSSSIAAHLSTCHPFLPLSELRQALSLSSWKHSILAGKRNPQDPDVRTHTSTLPLLHGDLGQLT